MNELNGFCISARDRLLRAWQESTGLVREYQEYAREVENENKHLSEVFATLALDEAKNSSRLLELLKKYN